MIDITSPNSLIDWIADHFTRGQILTTVAVVSLLVVGLTIYILFMRWVRQLEYYQSRKSNAPYGHVLGAMLYVEVLLPSACLIVIWIGSVFIYIFT